jgi:hypothetical protein
MGWLSDVWDGVFGGTDDTALRQQRDENRRAQEFIEEQAALGRGDALTLQPIVDASLLGGYQSAADTLGLGLQGGLDLFGQGNYQAQQNMLAGLPQYQRAILGLPVDNNALQAVLLRPQANLGPLTSPQMPNVGAPDSYATLLGGPGTERAQFADYIQPGLSNAAAIEQANTLGLLDNQAYKDFQKTFRNDPSVGSASSWADAGSAQRLTNRDWSSTSPYWQGTLTNFFNLMYPGG